MRAAAIWLTLSALVVVAPGVVAQSASGQVTQNSAECSASTTSTNPEDCADVIEAAVAVAPGDAGRLGAIYVAVLPVAGNGEPAGYQGGYATPGGWQIGASPAAYFTGPLPATWSHRFAIPGGVCAAAAAHGAPAGTYVAYAGYGIATQAPAVPTPNGVDVTTLLRQAEATGNTEIINQVRALADGQTSGGQALAASAGAEMLQAHTVWPIGRIHCE